MSTPAGPEASAPREPAQGGALQSALAAEHAAVFAYGVVGGILGPGDAAAVAAYSAHRGRRDQLAELIGPAAVAAEAAYDLPFEVSNDRQARRLARLIEQRCSGVYADIVSRSTGSLRALAARALTECAVRATAFGAEPKAFPGLGDPP